LYHRAVFISTSFTLAPKTHPSLTGFTECRYIIPWAYASNHAELANPKDGDCLIGPRDASSARMHHRRLLKIENTVGPGDGAQGGGTAVTEILGAASSSPNVVGTAKITANKGHDSVFKGKEAWVRHIVLLHTISSNRKLPSGGGVQGCKVRHVRSKGVDHLFRQRQGNT
jgi:hypothetical protein